MSLTTADLTLVEQRVTNDGPSTGATYLLWFFLWFFSAHRFYLGRPISAIFQILSYFILVGFIWLIIDAVLIPSMVRENQNNIRQTLIKQMQLRAG